ncbi:SAUGI family uracil-DNA glycosylase inhibitor [Jeotgalicoccus meleagridis]|uniref:Uncharacterized protein n=1 Tax=Jeotgalicoccus meleagridis TaxID=2759181 RepID=A0A6V7R2S6_9STAP|nr:SAUGI family uracil-DNA glycosylase inhibitor [Jeotgalicoccus meleagridis]CAD2071641.1 hypothetical protein JEODO184_00332 [Jeotgalicoccus meleagridis]
MNTKLKIYIKKYFPELSTLTWSDEAVSMSGDELFEDTKLKSLYENESLDTRLYYPIEINSAILPFEIYKEETLVALGYTNDESQKIIYFKHGAETLINHL